MLGQHSLCVSVAFPFDLFFLPLACLIAHFGPQLLLLVYPDDITDDAWNRHSVGVNHIDFVCFLLSQVRIATAIQFANCI